MQIAPATPADVPEIAAIYAHHVLHGTASFEVEPPAEAEMAARLERILGADWPWLVARGDDGAMVGYAYAAQFRDRAAYRYTCENSIYVRHDFRGEGVGKALMAALIRAAEAQGFRQMIAVIGGAGPASVALHRAVGFVMVGTLRAIGRKQGQWLDTVYMQLSLGQGAQSPPPAEPS